MRVYIILLFLTTFSSLEGFSQTVVSGRVTDALSGEPLPYVTIRAVGASGGTVTDFDGFYRYETIDNIDSIYAKYLGYATLTEYVKSDTFNEVNFALNEAVTGFKEVVVKPGGINPALIIMKRVRKRKKDHDPEKIEFYEYNSYNKIQLAVNSVTEKFKSRKVFKELEPMFDTISTFSDSSVSKVLPVFVSETLSNYYYRKTPRRTKEEITATKILGVGVGEESYVSQVLGATFQQYNFYDNNLYILDKDFISPLSIQGNSYYYYSLLDSVVLDGISCYQIRVDPKNQRDLVFKGLIWISTKDYALKQLSLEITGEANLNFIEKLKIQQEFEEVEPGFWLPNKTRILIDVAELTKNTAGIVGVYYSSAKNIKINQERELPFYEEKVGVAEEAFHKDQAFWDTARHAVISEQDKRVYVMVDSLIRQPLIKSYIDVVEIIVDGHFPAGKIELGPYHYLIGFNNLEGVRSRIGFRTSPLFHKDIMFRAYGAYGFKDEQFKFGLFGDYVFDRKKWGKFGAFIKRDVELIGITDEDIGTSALFDAFATFGTDQLNRSFTKRLWVEKELFKGYTQSINFTHKNFLFEPIGDFNFQYYSIAGDTTSLLLSDYTVSSIHISGRLSHKQQFLYRRNMRYNFGNLKAPVLTVNYTKSFSNVLGGSFSFDKVGLELWQWNSAGNIGTFEYRIKLYSMFGQAPYPSLFVMRGNQTIVSNKSAYNLMSWFEFAADRYMSVDYEHQFNGIILNRVPLINELKWRSFVNAKMVYGTISDANKALMPLNKEGITNPTFFDQNRPYIEAGYGIENIFKFIRVDFIHRLTYLDEGHPNARPFGIKFTAVARL